MAKTVFGEGTNLTVAFMTALCGIDAGTGHNHQGLDADGSYPQISLADSVDDFISGSFDGTVSSTYFTTPQTETFYYYRVYNAIILTIPEFEGFHPTSNELQIAPDGGTWPSFITPSTALIFTARMKKQDAAAGESRLGSITIPTSNSANMICNITGTDASLNPAGFGTAGAGLGNEKGISRLSVCYRNDV